MPMGLFTNVHRLRLTDAKHLFLRVLLGCLSVLAVAFACPHSFGAAERVVSGIVIDSAGFEVANASVQAMPRKEEKNGGTVGSLSWMKTDSHGRFSLRLSSGRYKIVAKDEADGYPDPVFMLSADPTDRFPEISVQEEDISGVRVMLGMRGGVLEGDLRDQETQNPIPQGKVVIRDARNAEAYVEVFPDKLGGQFQFTVPNKPVLVSATAPGYATTYFGNREEVTLSGGEHRHITIELTRRKP